MSIARAPEKNSQVGRPVLPEVVTLSLIIPAYNEAKRLSPYLESIRKYFDELNVREINGYEVIVVDDGSLDHTVELVSHYAEGWPQLRVRVHPTNRGKGAAIRDGILAARGELLLFADADGATPIEEERRLRAVIAKGADLAAGSRLLPGARRKRALHRAILGRLFAVFVRAFMPVAVRDTQCGFKMFRRDAGLHLFELCHEDGYLFDLHILAAAAALGYRVDEVAIRWREVPGSKISLFHEASAMAFKLLELRRAFRTLGGRT